MPPVPVITLAVDRQPGPEVACDVAGCTRAAVVTWQVTRTGILFGDRWVAGEDMDLCREHDQRAAVVTGAEDYVDG
ncbi:hypothetical protein AB0873_32205 [Micromonospora sp. NPDC047707]|uniref:hypothetical protein n=1 Tax=Micromonospora sp. NPDC047707 TaxID=3154498 RepID=UPI00345177DD